MFNKNCFNRITINGQTITCQGSNISILNGNVIVDGKVVQSNIDNYVTVIIDGNVNKLECSGAVEVHGNAGTIDCDGSCTVGGNVNGNIDAGGSVKFGVLMPNGEQSDIDDAKAVVTHLGIKSFCINIKQAVDDLVARLYYSEIDVSGQTRINLPPRIRMATLYAISQSLNGRVVCTDNLSESYVGYSTRWGDNVGDFSPLVNFTTDEVIAIGDALQLPYELVHKIPSDGLCGKTDEDNFGFTYGALNKYIREGVCDDEMVKVKIDFLHHKNLFKLQPIPSFPYSPNKK